MEDINLNHMQQGGQAKRAHLLVDIITPRTCARGKVIGLSVCCRCSLVPRPYEGEERAWYTLLAYALGAPEKCGAPDTIIYLVYAAYLVYALHRPTIYHCCIIKTFEF